MKRESLLFVLIGFLLSACNVNFVYQADKNDISSLGNKGLITENRKNIEMLISESKSRVISSIVSQGELKGYLAQPQMAGNYPSVLMIHEWWGLNDNIKQMADLLAGNGYNVLAIDLYGEVAGTPERAKELSGLVRGNPQLAINKMKLGVLFLKEKFGEKSKIASLGWCFGGQQSLQISLNEKLDATIIYYGNLETDPNKLKNISQPVLGIFGSKDNSVKIESVREFEKALEGLGKVSEIIVYDGLGHAFANPSGNNYAPKETMDAWQKTLDFLERNLKGGR